MKFVLLHREVESIDTCWDSFAIVYLFANKGKVNKKLSMALVIASLVFKDICDCCVKVNALHIRCGSNRNY